MPTISEQIAQQVRRIRDRIDRSGGRKGMGVREFARKVRLSPGKICQLEDPDYGHFPRISTLRQIADRTNHTLRITFEKKGW